MGCSCIGPNMRLSRVQPDAQQGTPQLIRSHQKDDLLTGRRDQGQVVSEASRGNEDPIDFDAFVLRGCPTMEGLEENVQQIRASHQPFHAIHLTITVAKTRVKGAKAPNRPGVHTRFAQEAKKAPPGH